MGRSEIQLTAKEYKTLLDQYGLNRRESQNPTETLLDKNQHNKADMGVVGSSRVSGQTQTNTFNNKEERDIYFARLNELKAQGDMARDEMERLSQDAVEQWRNDHDLPF